MESAIWIATARIQDCEDEEKACPTYNTTNVAPVPSYITYHDKCEEQSDGYPKCDTE